MSKRKQVAWNPDDRAALVEEAPVQLASVQWEYRVKNWNLVPRDIDDPGKEARVFEHELNAMGADGWECFAVIGGTTGVRCFFKRPKPPIWDAYTGEMSKEARESLHEAARTIQRDTQPRPDERPL